MPTKQQSFSLVKRSLITLGAAGAAAGVFLAREGDAQAQARFGEKGQLAITGENLFSLGTERYGDSYFNGDGSVTVNRFGFLYSQCGLSPRCPQIGGYYFIIPSLSIGATIGYESRGGSQVVPMNGGVTVTRTLPDESSFVFNPKVGYALMFGQVVGLWLRGGLGFFHGGSTDQGEARTHTYWYLSGDADLVVSPFQHFAFYAGPQFDLSFAGNRTDYAPQGNQSWGNSFRDFGVGIGLMGYVGL